MYPNFKITRKSYGGKEHKISHYLTQENEINANKIVAQVTIESAPGVKYLDIEVGKIAAYEALIKFKKTALNFTNPVRLL